MFLLTTREDKDYNTSFNRFSLSTRKVIIFMDDIIKLILILFIVIEYKKEYHANDTHNED